MNTVVLVCIVLALLVYFFYYRDDFHVRGHVDPDLDVGYPKFLIPVARIVTPGVVLLGYLDAGGSSHLIVEVAGLSFIGLGLLLLRKSKLDLGSSYAPLAQPKKPQQLVVAGVYNYIRNPIYVANLLLITGLVFLSEFHIVTILVLISMSLLYWYTISLEEKVLVARFKDKYLIYRANTGCLFPRLHTLSKLLANWMRQ